MKELHELKKVMMDELMDVAEEVVQKGHMSAGDLDAVNKMVKSIVRICDIVEMEEGGHSRGGNWRAQMEGDYGHGNSYRRRRDSMGRYSREDGSMSRNNGYSQNNNSMRGYSGDKGRILQMLKSMMQHDAGNDDERQALEECINRLENG